MNLKKFGLVGLFALVALAFALPATASADPDPNGVFLHNHEPIESNKTRTGRFTGPAAFFITAAPNEGVHCPTLHVGINFTSTLGHVHSFAGTGCTTTSVEAAKNNLPTHPSMVGSWTVDPNYETDSITITNVHINNKVTHPLTSHMVVGESTLKCPIIHANIPDEDPTVTIETVELEGTGCTAETGIPPAEPALGATISGHFHQVRDDEGKLRFGLGEAH